MVIFLKQISIRCKYLFLGFSTDVTAARFMCILNCVLSNKNSSEFAKMAADLTLPPYL